MLNKITFPANTPVEVGLAFAEPKEVDSQFGGKQLMYTTVDNRVFFVSPSVADKIRAWNPRRYDRFGRRLFEMRHSIDIDTVIEGLQTEFWSRT